jgi:hypothetical protein
MDLVLNNTRHTLIPIRQFRTDHQLPDIFSVTHFEPKDMTGLAHIDGAGEALDSLRQSILASIPPHLTTLPTFDFLDHFVQLFGKTLHTVNHLIGLKDVEIGYAVSGFGDMLNIWFYDQARAIKTKTPATLFDTLYMDWVANSGRRSEKIHRYQHGEDEWEIRLLNNAYGRTGLQVDMPTHTAYVHDTAYLCPAEGFMRGVLRDVAEKLAV